MYWLISKKYKIVTNVLIKKIKVPKLDDIYTSKEYSKWDKFLNMLIRSGKLVKVLTNKSDMFSVELT